jgi:pimeloyl-ACP methyl ester carboxylesterase
MRRECELRSFDDTRLYYSVEGEGDRDFILCDGIGCDGFIWRYLRPWLLERGRVVHLHMRAHGKSDAPARLEGLTIEACADDWGEVFQREEVHDATLLGHSMGVQVALETWNRHGDVVDALVLLCGSFGNPVSTFHDGRALERALPVIRRAAKLGGRALEAAWSRLVKLPVGYHVARLTEVHPDLVRRRDFEPYLAHLAAMNPKLFFELLASAGRHSAGPYLERIDVPTLIVAGVADRFTPAHRSEEMARRIATSQLLVLEEGTHTAPIEHPALLELELERFLAL